MPTSTASLTREILTGDTAALLAEWLDELRLRSDTRITAAELEAQCRGFIEMLADACRRGDPANPDGDAFEPLREMLEDIGRSRAVQGFSPSENAAFIFSLKQPLFGRIRVSCAGDPELLGRETWAVTSLIDSFGLFMTEAFQRGREEVIVRQQEELVELSTPVVKLWQGILALPLIGTLDSSRTQVVMENLLESIVRHEADIAIIDITGVPTVDTLVAQHLLKTIAAARLMGADCIISGIRPQIAQTMVHLGVELNVVSKANLADAFAVALRRIGRAVVPMRQRAAPTEEHDAQR
jgi:rsbT co-antagonist protein RsbR